MGKLKVGDVVRLRTGGPKMVVVLIVATGQLAFAGCKPLDDNKAFIDYRAPTTLQ